MLTPPPYRLRACRLLLCPLLVVSTAALPAFAAAWPTTASALSAAVAASYEAEERGVVAFDVTQNTAVRGGLYHRDDVDVTAFVESDGKLSSKSVLHHAEGAKADDGAALAKRTTEAESPLGRFGLRLPCDPSALADYVFDAPKAQADGVVLPFRAKIRDQAHGDGQIVLDAAHITSIAFTPAVPPDRASAASVLLTFGVLAPGRYGITRIVRTFDGHVGPLRGRVTSTSVYANVRAFASTSAAAQAIAQER